MADYHKQVKDAIQTVTNEKSMFSDIEKQKVLRKIRSGHSSKEYKSHHFVPKTITAIAISGFLLFIGGLIGSNLERNESSSSSQVVKNEHFYPKLQYGEVLNGWKLLNKGPYDDAKSKASGILQATFEGEAQITGTLKYYDMDDPNRTDQIFFSPDKLSLQSLPVVEGRHPELTFTLDEQQKLKAVFGLGAKRVDIGEVTLIVGDYKARYLEGKTLPDTVKLKEIILPEEPEVQTTPIQIQLETEQLALPTHLLDRYDRFKLTKDKQVLKGLTPAEVFQIYFYSEELQDYETQYALFIDDEEYVKVFATFEEYLTAIESSKPFHSGASLLEQVKSGKLYEHVYDKKSASVSIEGVTSGLSFGLSKNKDGIWCVNWLPIQ